MEKEIFGDFFREELNSPKIQKNILKKITSNIPSQSLHNIFAPHDNVRRNVSSNVL
jgi:hypothetical protein